MKNIVLSLIGLMLIGYGYTQTPARKSIDSKISEVTVFRNGAQIIRNGSLRVTSGETKIIFSELSSSIDPNSVQVKGTGGFTLLGVNHQLNYLTKTRRSEKIDSLQNLIDKLQGELNLSLAMSEVLNEELALLNANRDLGGTSGTDVNTLRGALTYYRTELTRIKKAQLKEKESQTELTQELNDLRRQLNILNNQRDMPTSEVEVLVNSTRTADIKLELSYYTRSAGWIPQYDVRVKDINTPISLTYKAMVYQNTGENWEKVKLIFSNANPNQSGTAPQLSPWYLDIITPQPIVKRKSAGYAEPSARKMEVADMMELSAAPEEEMMMEEIRMTSEVRESQTSFQYIVPVPYTIKSSAERTTIDLNVFEVPSQYEYFAVPKLDKDAFLMARVYDWDQYALLAGQVNLYFEDGYVGKSFLDPRTAGDTLNLSLGRDENIVVTRERIDKYTEKKTLGANKIESRGYEIEIRNQKSKTINITLFDQAPISTNSVLEVRNVFYGKGSFNQQTGEIKWKIEIEPNSTIKQELRYEVKYPKKSRVILE